MIPENEHDFALTRRDTDKTPAAPIERAAYEGVTMAVSPEEAKRRLQQLQAFVAGNMVRDLDYGHIPGSEKDVLLQPGAQKLAEIYGFAHRFSLIESIKDWERGFFYFEYRCELLSRRDGSLICEGIGSCNSRESKYAGRWVFAREIPQGMERSKLKRRTGTSQKTGRPYEQFLVPNEDIYSLVNTIQKMGAKRAYVHAVISATRSAGIFTQDVEDNPVNPAHDAANAHAEPQEADSAQASRRLALYATHEQSIHEATSLEQLSVVGGEIKNAYRNGELTREEVIGLGSVRDKRITQLKVALENADHENTR